MADLIEKKLTGIQILYLMDNIVRLESTPEKLNALPVKISWLLSRNKDTFMPIYEEFLNYSQTRQQEIKDNYFNEEKSYHEEVPERDADGNEILDEDGKPKMVDGLRIKDEFIEPYQKELDELNAELERRAAEEREVFILTYNLDEFFENSDDLPLTLADIEFLKFMNQN